MSSPIPGNSQVKPPEWGKVREDQSTGQKFISCTIKVITEDGQEKEYTVTARYKAANLEAHYEPTEIEATIKKIVDKIAADHELLFPSLAGSRISFNPERENDATIITHPNSEFNGKKIDFLNDQTVSDKGKEELDDNSKGKDPVLYKNLVMVSKCVHQHFKAISKRTIDLDVQDTSKKKAVNTPQVEFEEVQNPPTVPAPAPATPDPNEDLFG